MMIDHALVNNALFTILVLGVLVYLFKTLVNSLTEHVTRLEKSWEKYTDKLTTSINDVHVKLGTLQDEMRHDVRELQHEVSEIRDFMGGLHERSTS